MIHDLEQLEEMRATPRRARIDRLTAGIAGIAIVLALAFIILPALAASVRGS